MLEKGNTVAIPVQEHRQIVVDVFLIEIVRQLVKIQHSLRNLQSVVIDSTVRVLSQAEFLSEKRTDAKPSVIQACLVMTEVRRRKTKLNSFFEFRNGLNGLVQISFVHFVVQGEMNDFVKGDRNSLHL